MNILPSLSIDGFIRDREIILYKLFIYFLAGEKHRTFLFKDNIESLRYILSTYDQDDFNIINKIELSLNNLYINYFNNVETDVAIINTENNGILKLNISVVCYYKNKEFSLNKSLFIKDADIMNFEKELDDLYKYYNTSKGGYL